MGEGQAIPWEYAPAPEARDVVKLRERYGLFINGRDVEASSYAAAMLTFARREFRRLLIAAADISTADMPRPIASTIVKSTRDASNA